ncbi:hypothetical protein GCM10020229_62280 [Kitasatospora albolonga]
MSYTGYSSVRLRDLEPGPEWSQLTSSDAIYQRAFRLRQIALQLPTAQPLSLPCPMVRKLVPPVLADSPSLHIANVALPPRLLPQRHVGEGARFGPVLLRARSDLPSVRENDLSM